MEINYIGLPTPWPINIISVFFSLLSVVAFKLDFGFLKKLVIFYLLSVVGITLAIWWFAKTGALVSLVGTVEQKVYEKMKDHVESLKIEEQELGTFRITEFESSEIEINTEHLGV